MPKLTEVLTCTCPAYKFPHRFMGGKCDGQGVIDKVWDQGQCHECHYYYRGTTSPGGPDPSDCNVPHVSACPNLHLVMRRVK